MKNCFIDYEHRAIANLVEGVEMGVKGMIITRINVPIEHRSKGVGTKLLKEIIAEADKTNTTLWLEIAPSDGLNYGQLQKWYLKHGFRLHGRYGIYVRRVRNETL